jgi:hypothetical protein
MRTMIPLRVFGILTNTIMIASAIPTRNFPALLDALDMHLIWVERKRKYFCKRGWTGNLANITDLPVGQLGT